MKKIIHFRIDEQLFGNLQAHLFSGDSDEHGAVIAVGVVETLNTITLLARDLFLAEDGIDYIPGTRGYRALTPQFIADKSSYCEKNNLGYIAIHNHGGNEYVQFSTDDLNSHERGYPALLDITGGPVGALVFAQNAVAGDIWTKDGRYSLQQFTIIGSKIRNLYAEPPLEENYTDPIYDRNARLFGDKGQAILKKLNIAIIGLGGGGSLINEWVARLGVGHIIAVDFDKVESSNLPRIVGASRWDAMTFLTDSNRSQFLQKIGKKFTKYKVHVAKRVAHLANPKIKYTAVVGDILDRNTALLLKDVDFIFLATDSILSRNMFNAILHQYLIPGAQIGAKVRVDPKSEKIEEIFVVGRMVLPYQNGGCLHCNGWIPPNRLSLETQSREERKIQNYVEHGEVIEPSVITLNVLSASQIVNDFMMMFTGLYSIDMRLNHLMYSVDERKLNEATLRFEDFCIDCSHNIKSRFGKGDRSRLPYRMPPNK